MNKQNASLYLKDQINDVVPQTIYSFFERLSKVMHGESVVAIFGSLRSDKLIENSAIVLEDRIVYAEIAHILPKFKTVSLKYIDQVYLLSEGGYNYISVVDITKKPVRLNIKADATETNALYNLIKSYKSITEKKNKPTHEVVCGNCGANCTVYVGEETKCEYCGSSVKG